MNYIITKNKNYFENIGNYNFCGLEELKKLPDKIAIDTETTGLFTHEGSDLFCVQIGTGINNYIIDLYSSENCYTFYDLIPYLQGKILVGHNITFDLGFMFRYNFFPKDVRDTMLAYRILGNGKIYKASFKDVMLDVLRIDYDKTDQANISKVKLSQQSTIEYSFNDVDKLLELENTMSDMIDQREQTEVYILNCNFLRALAYYEQCGMPLDYGLWKKKVASDLVEKREKEIVVKEYIYDNLPQLRNNQLSLFDTEKRIITKISSPKQMLDVFKRFGINIEDDEGKESIDKTVLDKSNHPFIKIWLDYQNISHDVSTYGQNILDKHNNHRIYTTFNAMVDTGRLSTRAGKNKEGINFLNFPADKKTRICFRAKEGSYIIGCDYASQESRCLAATSNDENSILNVIHDRDSHSLLARQVYEELEHLSDKDIKDNHSDKRQDGKVAGFTIDLKKFYYICA